MRGQVTEVLKIYDSSDKQLVIPVYQRNYDWKIKHCEQLLNDLLDLIRFDRPKHFFGAVVGKPEDSWNWVVIDGQQRLTTVSLLMLAISKLIDDNALESTDSALSARIRRSYLLNDVETQKTRFRLKPVKDDSDAYRRLFGPENEFIESSNVTANYRYFLGALPKTGFTADEIWGAVGKLEVMHLDLEAHDDPQRIFESLNSTGLELSEADKVRNLVLMGLKASDQVRVYEDYWNRIEKNVDYDTDSFLRWYLVTKTSKTPRVDQVYDAFKTFKITSRLEGRELLSEVRDYSDYYKRLRAGATGAASVDARLRRLNIMKQDVVLPLLMPLLAEYHDNTVTESDFAESVQIIESYLFRRFVSSIPTNSLNKTFAYLYKDVRKLRTAGATFAEVLAYSLTRRTSTALFPNDEQFKADFATRNMYKIQSDRRRYLFECLENRNSNDTREIANALEAAQLTVEHIMPQTITEAWRNELGENAEEVHDTWINRIANLTVTGYNSLYSNSSFLTKKTTENGFNDSPYRLNRTIKEAKVWNEEELQKRSQMLTEAALEYWQFPITHFEPVTPQLPVEPLGTETGFTNRTVVGFELLDTKATVQSWRELLLRVLQTIALTNRDKLFEYAATADYFLVNIPEGSEPRTFRLVVPGLFVNVSSSTKEKVTILRRVFDHLDLDPNELLLTLRNEEVAEDTVEVSNLPTPFESFKKFLEPLKELRQSHVQPEETDYLCKEIRSAFANLKTENATVAQKIPLQLISSKIIEEDLLEEPVIHRSILDGSLLSFIEKLTAT